MLPISFNKFLMSFLNSLCHSHGNGNPSYFSYFHPWIPASAGMTEEMAAIRYSMSGRMQYAPTFFSLLFSLLYTMCYIFDTILFWLLDSGSWLLFPQLDTRYYILFLLSCIFLFFFFLDSILYTRYSILFSYTLYAKRYTLFTLLVLHDIYDILPHSFLLLQSI